MLNSTCCIRSFFILRRVLLCSQVKNDEDFVNRLGCRPDELLKVVSIFGNTGEGKSHTLNHTFFLGGRS